MNDSTINSCENKSESRFLSSDRDLSVREKMLSVLHGRFIHNLKKQGKKLGETEYGEHALYASIAKTLNELGSKGLLQSYRNKRNFTASDLEKMISGPSIWSKLRRLSDIFSCTIDVLYLKLDVGLDNEKAFIEKNGKLSHCDFWFERDSAIRISGPIIHIGSYEGYYAPIMDEEESAENIKKAKEEVPQSLEKLMHKAMKLNEAISHHRSILEEGESRNINWTQTSISKNQRMAKLCDLSMDLKSVNTAIAIKKIKLEDPSIDLLHLMIRLRESNN